MESLIGAHMSILSLPNTPIISLRRSPDLPMVRAKSNILSPLLVSRLCSDDNIR
jgi:hypothetical protein